MASKSTNCIVLFLLVCFLPLGSGLAQSGGKLTIRKILTEGFPSVLLSFTATINNAPIPHLKKSDVALFENTDQQTIVSLQCPDDTVHRWTIALLLDRSSSMAQMSAWSIPDPDSTKIRKAKSAFTGFLRTLGSKDQAAVFSFSSDWESAKWFQMDHDFSNDTSSLIASLVPITALGGTRLWDALGETIRIITPMPGMKAIIAITDGWSNSDRITYPAVVIEQAAAKSIPIHIVGLGDFVPTQQLKEISTSTGGRYFSALEAEDLYGVFQDLSRYILNDACVLRYVSTFPCPDSTDRFVQLVSTAVSPMLETDTTYSVAKLQLHSALMLQPDSIPVGNRPLTIACRSSLQFRSGIPISFSCSISGCDYPLNFIRVRTDSSIFKGATFNIDTSTAGVVRVYAVNAVPKTDGTMLFHMDFNIAPLSRDTLVQLVFDTASFQHECPINIYPLPLDLFIGSCFESYTLSVPAVAHWKMHEFMLPVVFSPDVPYGRMLQGTLSVLKNNSGLRLAGAKPMGRAANPSFTLTQSAFMDDIGFSWKHIDSTAAGIMLGFESNLSKNAGVTQLVLNLDHASTGCKADFSPDTILVYFDGVCDQIVERAESKRVTVSPNPAYGNLQLHIRLDRESTVRCRLANQQGAIVADFFEGRLPAGMSSLTLNTGKLPSSMYFVLVETSDGVYSAQMNVMK